MNDRNRELDSLVIRFLAALEDGDFKTVEKIWSAAASDPELEGALTGAAGELAAEYDREFDEHAGSALESVVKSAMPTAEVIRPSTGPVTVAEVADHIRRTGAPGLVAADLVLNDALSRISDPVPEHLGLSSVIAWGAGYGAAPESYWKLFRQSALSLKLRRESDTEYRLAARPARPKQTGGHK
jgi:hypothetical protein